VATVQMLDHCFFAICVTFFARSSNPDLAEVWSTVTLEPKTDTNTERGRSRDIARRSIEMAKNGFV
jgi:hypothetical protein